MKNWFGPKNFRSLMRVYVRKNGERHFEKCDIIIRASALGTYIDSRVALWPWRLLNLRDYTPSNTSRSMIL